MTLYEKRRGLAVVTLGVFILLGALALAATSHGSARPTLALSLLVLIAGYPLIALSFSQDRRAPLVFSLWAIAFSLLWLHASVGNRLWGFDINVEYYLSHGVETTGIWSSSIHTNANAMLSVTMLVPMVGFVTGIGAEATLKYVVPLIFSFLPICLFLLFSLLLSPRGAYAAALLVVFTTTFYTEMLQVARQEIAEVVGVLLFYVLLKPSLTAVERSILFVLLASATVVAHYGLSYVLLGLVIASGLVALIFSKRTMGPMERTKMAVFAAIAFGWYLYASGGSALESAVQLGSRISESLLPRLFDPSASAGLSALTERLSIWRGLTRYAYLVVQGLVVLGTVSWFLAADTPMKRRYASLGIVGTLLLIAAVALPYFAAALNPSRLHHMVILILAPMFVVGIGFVIGSIRKRHISQITSNVPPSTMPVAAGLLCLFFLLNVGVVYYIAGDSAPSILLSREYDFPLFSDQEVAASEWSSTFHTGLVKADAYRYPIVLRTTELKDARTYDPERPAGFDELMVLGNYNLRTGDVRVLTGERGIGRGAQYVPFPSSPAVDRVYSAGGSAVVWFT